MNLDVVVVDIIGAAVSAMSVSGISNINYQPGRNIQILKSLQDLDNSITLKNTKYPLIAMVLPVTEKRDRSVGGYIIVKIPRIVIATRVSGEDGTQDIFTRYQTGGTFKSILYPCYYEFLNQLAWNPSIIGEDPDSIEHTKMDNPGTQPAGEGLSDFVDSIELINLELKLNQIKTC